MPTLVGMNRAGSSSFPHAARRALGSLLAVALAVGGLMAVSGEAAAQAGRERTDQSKRSAAIVKPPAASELLDQLASAKDETSATSLANRIERLWQRSGSDTADLLMSRAAAALEAKDIPLSIELIDRAITLKPDWADAYSRRATAFYLLGDYQRAMIDLQETLRREPRHFNALAGVGIIYQAYGDQKQAFAAYKRALAVHPHLEMVKKSVERLSPDVDGRNL